MDSSYEYPISKSILESYYDSDSFTYLKLGQTLIDLHKGKYNEHLFPLNKIRYFVKLKIKLLFQDIIIVNILLFLSKIRLYPKSKLVFYQSLRTEIISSKVLNKNKALLKYLINKTTKL